MVRQPQCAEEEAQRTRFKKKGGWDFLRRLTQVLNDPELSVSILEVPTDVFSASCIQRWGARRFEESRVA